MSHTSLTALYRWEGEVYEIQASEIHDEIETYMQKHPECSKKLAKENVLAKYGGTNAFQCFEGHSVVFHFWEKERESSHFQHPPSGHPRENISPEDVCPCINPDYQTGIRARLLAKQAVAATGVKLQNFCCTSPFQTVKSTIAIPCGSRYLLNHTMDGKQGYKSGTIRTDAICFDGKVIPFNISKRNRNDPASVNMVKLDPKHVIEACENTMGKTPPFLYPRAPDTKCSACTARGVRQLWCTAIRDVMQQNKERKEREEREREREERERERERVMRQNKEPYLFTQLFRVAPTLATILGLDPSEPILRSEVHRRLISYIKDKNHQLNPYPYLNPNPNKKDFLCDDALASVFAVDKGCQLSWFDMSVFLHKLLVPVEKADVEEAREEREKHTNGDGAHGSNSWEERLKLVENKARTAFANLERNKESMIEARTRNAKIATDFEDLQAAKEEQKRKRNEEYELKKNLPVQEAVITPGFSVVISSLPLTEPSEQDREAVMEGIAQKRMERLRRQEAKGAKRLKKRSQ